MPEVHVANEKAMQLIVFAKQQKPVWRGKIEEEGDWLHVVAERDHPEFGHEKVELWWQGKAMKRPPEYSRNGQTVVEKNSAEIRRRLAGEPTIATKNAFDGTVRRARAIGDPSEHKPTARTVKKQKLAFTIEDDDETILEALCGHKVLCTSVIADDFPLVEHVVPPVGQAKTILVDGIKHRVPVAHAPHIVRLDEDTVNLDYVSAFGFRSLRVNNVVRVR